MRWNIDPARVAGLPKQECAQLQELLHIYERHESGNRKKEKYYEGQIRLSDVNLGIALPEGMRGLEIGCAWGAKTVDVLAARSMFDGYVATNGTPAEGMSVLVAGNDLIPAYQKACRDELKYGCTFATLSADEQIGCKIRFHTPQTAAAAWDGNLGRIAYGAAVIATAPDETQQGEQTPIVIYLHTDEAVWELLRISDSGDWAAICHRHRMGRPLMEPLIWNATSLKPLGRSRIKEPIRRLIDGYVRTIANATIGLEFATSPQKYLLGVTDEQYDVVVNQKFKQYVGAILAATANPDTGEKPSFGQLQQGSITPHVEMLRVLATQFAAATGLSVTDTGVVNDANPTSSDAIEAQTKTLVGMAEQLNAGNAYSLRQIALMAQAVAGRKPPEQLTDEERDVIAHFKNPAMPNMAATADAAMKIASARQEFAKTDVFYEMLGFSAEDIRRIKAQERRARGIAMLQELDAE